MMKTVALVLLSFALAIGSFAIAHAAGQSTSANEAAAAAHGAAKAEPVRKPVPRPGDHDCLRSTGSHIPPKPGHCLSVPGRSYSGKDIQRTGATNLGDALRMLDPSIH